MWRAPTGLGEPVAPLDQAQFGVPVRFEPGTNFGADRGFVDFAHVSVPSRRPMPHHLFTVVTGVAEQHLRTFGPFEPEMRVVVPGETNPAVDLDRVDGGLHI